MAVPADAVIASGWDDDGFYPSLQHHNHAAIYIRNIPKGLEVIDQWPGIDFKQFRPHLLRFGNKKNYPSNDGDAFFLVLTKTVN